jgi:hypothetical protein
MDRYLVFAGDTYYPAGGFKDFKAGYATCEGAVGYAAGFVSAGTCTWAHVYDTEAHTIVFETRR